MLDLDCADLLEAGDRGLRPGVVAEVVEAQERREVDVLAQQVQRQAAQNRAQQVLEPEVEALPEVGKATGPGVAGEERLALGVTQQVALQLGGFLPSLIAVTLVKRQPPRSVTSGMPPSTASATALWFWSKWMWF